MTAKTFQLSVHPSRAGVVRGDKLAARSSRNDRGGIRCPPDEIHPMRDGIHPIGDGIHCAPDETHPMRGRLHSMRDRIRCPPDEIHPMRDGMNAIRGRMNASARRMK
jgi:hypothetical protein